MTPFDWTMTGVCVVCGIVGWIFGVQHGKWKEKQEQWAKEDEAAKTKVTRDNQAWFEQSFRKDIERLTQRVDQLESEGRRGVA